MPNYFDTTFKAIRSASLRIALKSIGHGSDPLEELTPELPITTQKKPDALAIINKGRPDAFILQLEIQSANDPNMVRRMLLYRAMLIFKHGLPVYQIVWYTGSEPLRMENCYDDEMQCNAEFELVDIRQHSAAARLSANDPDEILLAILSGYEGKAPTEILNQTVQRLRSVIADKGILSEYLRRLLIFSKSRNLYNETLKIVHMLDVNMKPEEDLAYIYSQKRAEEGAIRMLKKGYAHSEIAEIQSIPLDRIKALAQQLR